MAKEDSPGLFNGDRTKRLVFELNNHLANKGMDPKISVIIAEQVADIIETLDSKEDSDGYKKIKTLMFFSEMEYAAIAEVITKSDEVIKAIPSLKQALDKICDAEKENNEKAKEAALKEKEKALKAMDKVLQKGALAKAIKAAQLKDAADIALFGRMVANDHSLTVEAASMFSHALSTHKVDNEIDFFTAVDDLQPKEESGAGMTGTLEFNSATYYRFAALNLDMLANSEHLESMSREERQSVVRTFVEATIKAIPGARKNTMNGNTLPDYVLGVVRENGHPVQLVNAFENPVRQSQGYSAKSVELLKSEYAKLADTWGIEAVFERAIPDVGMRVFLDGVVEHVI
jgi:CRISPR system Cascade subunit CasC